MWGNALLRKHILCGESPCVCRQREGILLLEKSHRLDKISLYENKDLGDVGSEMIFFPTGHLEHLLFLLVYM